MALPRLLNARCGSPPELIWPGRAPGFGRSPVCIPAADLNGDGDDEIVVSNGSTGSESKSTDRQRDDLLQQEVKMPTSAARSAPYQYRPRDRRNLRKWKRPTQSRRRLEWSTCSLRRSPAAPLCGVRQCEQVQAGEILQGEREHRQEAQPVGIPLLGHGDAVDDDDHREGNGQPAVCKPNPSVPVQWDLLRGRCTDL